MMNNTSSHSTDDDTCTACKKSATILTECDHCSHWFCDSCNGLTPDIVSNMTALSEAGLSWFCTTCRSIPRPLNKSFTNSSSQTLSLPPTTPTPNSPTSPTIQILPTCTTSPPDTSSHTSSPTLPSNTHTKPHTCINKTPFFNTPYRKPIPSLLPHKSDKLAWKKINNPPNTPLINFVTGKPPTISHTVIGAVESGNDSVYLNKLFSSINIHLKPHIHSHRIPHSPNSSNYTRNQPKPLIITYLTLKSKQIVNLSLHLIKQSNFPVRFCEPLTKTQLIARANCAAQISNLNSTHPISNYKYAIRGTTNFYIALIPLPPPITLIS